MRASLSLWTQNLIILVVCTFHHYQVCAVVDQLLYKKGAFHVVVSITSISNFWRHLYVLDSQLAENDLLTFIVEESLASAVNTATISLKPATFEREMKLIKSGLSTAQIYEMRNNISLNSSREFIWHVNEDTILRADCVSALKSTCRDPVKSCILLTAKYRGRDRLPIESFVTPAVRFRKNEVMFGVDEQGYYLFNILSRRNSNMFSDDSIVLFIDQQRKISTVTFSVQIESKSSADSPYILLFNESVSGYLDASDAWALSVSFCAAMQQNVSIHGNQCRMSVFDLIVQKAILEEIYVRSVISESVSAILESELLVSNSIFGTRGVSSVLRFDEEHKMHFNSSDVPSPTDQCIKNCSAFAECCDYDRVHDWEVVTNLYVINCVDCPLVARAAYVYLTHTCGFTMLDMYHIDEGWDDVSVPMMNIMAHVSALRHLVQSNRSFGIILSEGQMFANATTVRSQLENFFYWTADVFDIVFFAPESEVQGSQQVGRMTSVLRRLSSTQRLAPYLQHGFIITRNTAALLLRSMITVVAQTLIDYPLHVANLYISLHEFMHTRLDLRIMMLPVAITNTTAATGVRCAIEEMKLVDVASNNSMHEVPRIRRPVFNEGSKLIVADLTGNIGTQLFNVFTALSLVNLHDNYDYRLVLASGVSDVAYLNLLSDLPRENLYNASAVESLNTRECGSGDDAASCSQFNSYFTKYLGLLKGAASDDSSRPKSFVGNLQGNRCRVPRSGYRATDQTVSAPYPVLHLQGAFRSFRSLHSIRALIFGTVARSASQGTLEYLQMIMTNIITLAGPHRPIIFVAADNWEGDPTEQYPLQFMPLTYLQASTAAISLRYAPIVPFYVFFSAEMNAVRELFGAAPNACFLDLNTMPAHFTLLLMACMDGGITSTSLFSRWAAYLLESRVMTHHNVTLPSSGFASPPLIVAPRRLSQAESVPGINSTSPRSAAQRAMWGCMYPSSWITI